MRQELEKLKVTVSDVSLEPRLGNKRMIKLPFLNILIRSPGLAQQTSLKWYSTIAVLSGTLAPAGTFFKNTDKICAAFMQIVSFLCK